jgi:allophanate hydrolase
MTLDPIAAVNAAYDRIEAEGRHEIWVTLRFREDVLSEAKVIAERVAAGEDLPLAGRVIAVKDNIDVAGLPTTAGAPSYLYRPTSDATAVARLRAAGAVVIGKTNLDQFATGLVGTRSPYGAVRNAWDPTRISGGSSAGSAVAVALGIVDAALGTDTAGSGRVPAALNAVVGVKPTKGLVPVTGVVPACYSLDCVTVFARDLALGRLVAELMSGPDAEDPLSREARADVVLPPRPRVAVPAEEHLAGMAPGWREAFAAAAASRPPPVLRSPRSTSHPCWRPRRCCTAALSSPNATPPSAPTSRRIATRSAPASTPPWPRSSSRERRRRPCSGPPTPPRWPVSVRRDVRCSTAATRC